MSDMFNDQRVVGVRALESVRASYVFNVGQLAVTATGPAFLLKGSATKIIRLNRVEVSGTLTTKAVGDVLIARYSDLTVAGTAGVGTIGRLDNFDPIQSAVPTCYTVPPTIIFNRGFRQSKAFFPDPASGPTTPVVWEFGRGAAKSMTLRGENDYAGILLAFASYAGAAVDINVEWTEEDR